MSETLDKLAAELGRLLQDKGLTLATAESCTAGWIAKVVTDIPGSSAWFDRGFVTYSNTSKQQMLGVSAASLAKNGAVSAEVVSEMARAQGGGEPLVQRLQFAGDRNEVRHQSVRVALERLLELLRTGD
jgi:nicotinamide-nucleotide amidase